MLRYKFADISDFSDGELQSTYTALSDRQKEYLDSLNSTKRKQSLCARALLARILNYYNIPVCLSSLNSKNNGKPYLIGSRLFVSFTHSNQYVGCAISDASVGIDIEKIKDVKDKVILRVCNEEEITYISSKGISAFFEIWTFKEAYIKAFDKKLNNMSDISFLKEKDTLNRCISGEIDGYKWHLLVL